MVETAVKQKAIRYIEQLDDEETLRVIAYIETFPKKESDEEFNAKMKKGIDDLKNGRVKTLDESFSAIKERFA